MGPPEDLLNALCAIRRIAFAVLTRDLRIALLGGVSDPWPELYPGDRLVTALPELRGREAELREHLEAGRPFVLRWLARPGHGRLRYFEAIVQTHPTDEKKWICWMYDRTPYGRLKARIDQYYAELIAHDDQPTLDEVTAADRMR